MTINYVAKLINEVDRKIGGRTISNYAKKSVREEKNCVRNKEILVYNTTIEKHQ